MASKTEVQAATPKTAEAQPATSAAAVPTPAKRMYNLSQELRKEQDTYMGRLKYTFATINPLQAFISAEKAKWAKEKMEDFEKRKLPDGTVEFTEQEIADLRKAHCIYTGIFHPDTKEKIPAAFRMSWFVPTNLPIIFGMMCVPQSLFNVIFFQWVNQTYNACWNYCNRNATCSFSNKELAMSYGAAVTSSIAVALVGRKLAQKFGTTTGSISRQRFVNGAVAVCALSCAGFLNLYLIRYNEMRKGIQVTNQGKNYGISKKAAEIAVTKSASTRAVLPIPMVLIIPGLWKLVEVLKLAPKSKAGNILTDMMIVTLQLTVSLPIALSLFTQELSVPKEKLESQFQDLKDEKGNPIKDFIINKGM